MGSMVEINDTLQINEEQGFPSEILDIKKHLAAPYTLDCVIDKAFEFKNKPSIRVFQQPPVKCSFVQSVIVNGAQKWIYWGMCLITETLHDNINKTTSGKYKIARINTPEEMAQYFKVRDGREEFDYFA